MKKVFLGIASIIFVLALTSCAHHIEPIKTEVVNFDMKTAKQMVEKGDKLISDIEIKDKVSRQEYNEFVKKYSDVYGWRGDEPWGNTLFYYKDVEDSKITTIHLTKEDFYPTIYHQGIEITSAKITNTYYQNSLLNESSLTIREAYIGSDVKMKDWYRDYCYKKNDKSIWEFNSFGGVMNFDGENFTPHYLKLK